MRRFGHALGRARRSIAVRLSLMQLAVFVLMLAGVGVHFNGILGREFDARADVELYGKIELVQRVLGELPSARAIAGHRQHFDDLLIGQHRLVLAILDPEGAVLYRAPGFDASTSGLLDGIREHVRSGREGNLIRPGNHGEFLARTAKGWTGGGADALVWIAVAVDMRDHREVLRSHGKTMLIALLLGAAVTTLGGLWMIRRGLAPVRRLAAAEERISAGRLDERIESDEVPLEFERLVEGFNAMLDRLHDSFRRLSDFSSDLAHELRTPINSLLGHAHVALSRPRTAEVYAVAIEAIAEDGERVARIVREMLFLAQADNASAALTKETLDLRAELDKIVAYFEVLASERGVVFACSGRADVRADRTLLQRAISNLLSNAIWHTPRGGTVSVSIGPLERAGAYLEVSNPGPGIQAEHLARIFDRFYQVQTTRGDHAGRVGLGLAIVKSIMGLHGGSVTAASPPDGPTSFRLEFAG